MLNSQSAIAAVRRHSTPEQASRVAAPDSRDMPPEQLTSAESSGANPAMAQADASSLSLFWLFLEGFAVYGALFHGFATTAVTIGSEVGARRPLELTRRQRRKSISLVSSSAPVELTVLEHEDPIDRAAFGKRIPSRRDGDQSVAREVDRYRFVHPGWLSMIWRAIASGWAARRREREIKRAVAALADYDDRMLLDMGFSHRSQIEQIVRNGRDC